MKVKCFQKWKFFKISWNPFWLLRAFWKWDLYTKDDFSPTLKKLIEFEHLGWNQPNIISVSSWESERKRVGA